MYIEGYSTRTFKVDCSRMTTKQLLEHIKAQKEKGIYKRDFIDTCENELKKRQEQIIKENPPLTTVDKQKKKKQKKKKKKMSPSKKPSLKS